MEENFENFTKVWIAAISSMSICYYVTPRIPAGFFRLLSLLPIIFLFIFLPFHLSSFHLGGSTVSYLVWFANFKLLLFSFDDGPLSSKPPLPLLHFISIAVLPIKNKHHHSFRRQENKSPSINFTRILRKSIVFAIKLVLLHIIVCAYDYRQYLEPHLIIGIYCVHLYLGLELVQAITALPVHMFLGLDLEPQFNEPYLATSLQDFWGRRWNLTVTGILRPTVYLPVRRLCTSYLGRSWGKVAAYLATFLVSGLMHEVLYFYVMRIAPTWEVTWFFVLNGVCTAAEVALKKALPEEWRLHRAVSGPLTLGFVVITSYWLFFPQPIRNRIDLRAINEYWMFVNFVSSLFGSTKN